MVNFWVDTRIQRHSFGKRSCAKAVAAAEAVIEQQESYLVDKLP
jgi:hypothetical protein